MKTKLKSIILFAGFLVIYTSCFKKNNNDKEKISVVTTIFPVYNFACQIGRDHSNVLMLLPPGLEAHHYDPTPQDMIKVTNSHIFIYLSKNMELWINKINNLKNIKNVIEVAANIDFIKEKDRDSHKEESSSNIDPHIWLDFDNCKKIAFNILNAYILVAPEKKDYFIRNYEILVKQLDEVDKKYKEVLSKCRIKTIIYAGHPAFGYLAKRYGLTQTSPYLGFSMESEPTAEQIIKLINTIREIKTNYIFYEKMLNNKIAQTLAKEAKVKLLELNPAHNVSKEEFKNGITFVDIMNKNLENLKKGLDYKE